MKSISPALLALLILVAGCSSKSKKTSDGSTPTASSGEALDADASAPTSKSPDAPPAGELKAAPTGQAASDTKYKALTQVLRGTSKTNSSVQDEATKILAANPTDPVALNTLALMNLRRGKPGATKLLINRALEKNPPSASLLNNLGVALLEEGDQEGAIVEFKKALQLDDHHTEALGNLGSIYAQGGDYQKALSFLEKSYKQNRGKVAVANNYALSLRATKDYEGARKVYEDALKTNSKEIPLLLNCAILYIDYMNKPKEGLDLVYKVKLLETSRKDVLNRANALAKKAESELK